MCNNQYCNFNTLNKIKQTIKLKKVSRYSYYYALKLHDVIIIHI